MRALVLLLLLASPLAAQSPGDLVRAELLPGWREADGTHVAAIRLTLAPGWKTYWRSPGSAGLAPILDFGGSTGVARVEPVWPTPEVFAFGGLRSVGYHDALTLPLRVTPDGTGAMHLDAALDIGVCDEICVPVRLDLDAALPAEGARDPAIAAALVDRPRDAGIPATCAATPDRGGLAIDVTLPLPPMGGDEMAVIETTDPALRLADTVTTRDGDRLLARVEARGAEGAALLLDRSRLRVTVLGGGRAVEVLGCSG